MFEKDWIRTLNHSTCEENFTVFAETINTVMDSVYPDKTVKISHKRKFVEPWMTHGIETASRKKLRLYKLSLMQGAMQEDVRSYKEYRNKYNKLK